MDDPLPLKQVEVLLDMQSKKLMREIAELKEEVLRVKEDLSREIKEVRKFQEASPAIPATPQPTPVQEAVQPAQVATTEAAPSTAPIDRNEVSPADVSIEKIFYSGGQ